MKSELINNMDKRLIKISKEKRKACDILVDLIEDEKKAPPMYEKLLSALSKLQPTGIGEKLPIPEYIKMEILNIITQEERHKETLEEISSMIICENLSKSGMLLEKDQYRLPVHERTRRAREFLKSI